MATPYQPAFPPDHYLNRELSWLEFNARVLEEAADKTNPPLERLKFLAIFSSNLDEFFEVRVAGLQQQLYAGIEPQDYGADGLDPAEQLSRVAARVHSLVAEQHRLLDAEIMPGLAAPGGGHSASRTRYARRGGARLSRQIVRARDLSSADAAGHRSRPSVPARPQQELEHRPAG